MQLGSPVAVLWHRLAATAPIGPLAQKFHMLQVCPPQKKGKRKLKECPAFQRQNFIWRDKIHIAELFKILDKIYVKGLAHSDLLFCLFITLFYE